MKFIGVIPARFGSTRFPGKPLALIHNKPMIQHVYEQVSKSTLISDVIVATDHEDILNAVTGFGGKAVMTSNSHQTGSDRINEVAEFVDGDFFINIQGDEPLINPALIDELILAAKSDEQAVITAKTKIVDKQDIADPNIVKVVCSAQGYALYFSRSTIPYNRSGVEQIYYKHLGIYCYPKQILQNYVSIPLSGLEQSEMLEQLRLLENDMKIKVIETKYSAVGVDTPEDIAKVEQILGGYLNV